MTAIKRSEVIAYASSIMGHKTYGDYPYIYHLALVESVLLGVGLSYDREADTNILLAAYLHDALEDAGVSPNDIIRVANREVAELVRAVTADVRGWTRDERHRSVVASLRSFPEARVLKLADRVANTLFSQRQKSSMYAKYAKEYPEFRRELWPGSAGGPAPGAGWIKTYEDRLWSELDGISSPS